MASRSTLARRGSVLAESSASAAEHGFQPLEPIGQPGLIDGEFVARRGFVAGRLRRTDCRRDKRRDVQRSGPAAGNGAIADHRAMRSGATALHAKSVVGLAVILLFEQILQPVGLLLLGAVVERLLVVDDSAQQGDHFVVRFEFQHAVEDLLHLDQDRRRPCRSASASARGPGLPGR